MRKTLLLVALLWPALAVLQAQNYGTGLQFNDEAYEQQPIKASLTRSLYGPSLPSQHSLKKWAPSPKTQGQYGTCVAWSTAYAAYSISENQKNNITELTAKNANTFSPPFVYRLISQDMSCASGTYIHDALTVLKTQGVPPHKDYNPLCADPDVPNHLLSKASSNKIKDFARLFTTTHNNDYKIMVTQKAISEGKPVIIGMAIPPSFSFAKGVWSPTEDPSFNYGGHAMTVVGYDDNQFGGAFEIMNSWGDNWGNDGFIWVRYADYANFTKYGYEMFEFPKVVPENWDLGGAFALQLPTGTEMPVTRQGNYYRVTQPYRSGTQFCLMISNNEPAFVYCFGTDATQATFQIFPHDPKVSPALTYKKNNVAIPDEDHFIEMDQTVGTDYMFVLYSKKPLDLNQIRRRFESQMGDPIQKLQFAVGTDLVQPSSVEMNNNKMTFRAKSGGKDVVALAVAIQHVQ